jgi:hypothetical protein
LQTIPITWPFEVWNLDMVGPLRQAPGEFTHLLVVVDKFSKWIEVRPIINVCSEEAVSFFTDIIYHFVIPNTIITDNGTQFTGKKFLNFCDDNHIRVDWSAVAHPLVVASFDTILAWITRAPATTTNESGSDKEQAANQTRRGGDRQTYH